MSLVGGMGIDVWNQSMDSIGADAIFFVPCQEGGAS
jgi:hypothetical protein